MPRVFSTGPDTYTTNSAGQQVYQGGWCEVKNGQISVRNTRAGKAFDASLYGRNPQDPTTACARTVNGTKLPKVEDRNLQAYQFIYEFKFPTDAQCQSWFNTDVNTCKTFFINRYAKDLAGATSGSRILATYTYYGSYDDKYTKFVGWVNPDINGPRKSASDAFVRGYDGYSVYAL
jgi:hypothetical protein